VEFWSKGLGKRSMTVEIGTETVAVEDDLVLLRGTVKPPLSWKYQIEMDADDWVEFFGVATHPVIVRHLLARNRLGVAARALGQLARFFGVYLVACVRVSLPGGRSTSGAGRQR